MFISKTSCCWWNAFFCHINVCTLFGRVSLYVYGWLVHCLGKKFADNLTNGFSKYLNFIIIAKFLYDYYNENKKCLPFMLNIFDIFLVIAIASKTTLIFAIDTVRKNIWEYILMLFYLKGELFAQLKICHFCTVFL